jgi:hypothetical protein
LPLERCTGAERYNVVDQLWDLPGLSPQDYLLGVPVQSVELSAETRGELLETSDTGMLLEDRRQKWKRDGRGIDAGAA